ncbi:ABC transporter permease [Roseinatronobacter alkalisoli]|uniref:Iron ABC transporter permease n=1 Tax=Roseinatronobacter alkalisoli TaxID=3028235 RepID=A0ABT5T9A7_9RHOB|nr:iron ABC transporter permease [Roseinatronobacter sp. HJB301]MDD7971697.1 iron ABC transporter permease [Roseinatronobacter sp. HJB301]
MPRARVIFSALGLAIGGLMVLPLIWLVMRAFQADLATVIDMFTRPRTLQLLGNTFALVVCTLVLATAMALPLAWLVSRTDLKYRRVVNILAVIPLATPGYVMAYALIGLSGNFGFMNQVFGFTIPRLQGLWGATLALALYTFPYIYLNLRAAFSGLDQSLEEAARALGATPREVFFRVTLPHLMPALMAGWLVVGLYVIGDFGAVALMRYEVFSYAIYLQYSAMFDRVYAAWLALMLIAIALSVVWWESRLREGAHFARTGSGAGTGRRRLSLSLPGQFIGWGFVVVVVLASIGLPVAVLSFWMVRLDDLPTVLPALVRAFSQSLSVAVPSALMAAAMALPVAVLAVRYPSRLSTFINRLAFVGYAVPALAFALAFVFFSLNAARFLYQTQFLLVTVYALSFLALALGPIRSALYQARPSVEESARALGYGPFSVFAKVTLPTIRPGVVAGMVLVFVIAMKELPIAFLLAPTGFRPLSITMFSRTSEGMLMEAAPYAAAIMAFSALFVGFVLRHDKKAG